MINCGCCRPFCNCNCGCNLNLCLRLPCIRFNCCCPKFGCGCNNGCGCNDNCNNGSGCNNGCNNSCGSNNGCGCNNNCGCRNNYCGKCFECSCGPTQAVPYGFENGNGEAFNEAGRV